MYAKSFTVAFAAIWLFNACLATAAPEPKPEAYGGSCGCVSRCHTVPVHSCVPIKTTHSIINDCGYGNGWGYGGYGNGWGYGGYGNGWGYGSGCGCGYGNGWGYGSGYGYGNGWGYGGWGCGCGGWV